MEFKQLLFSLILSALIVYLTVFIIEGITFPLCEYSINDKVNAEFTASHSRSYGMLTYIEKKDNDYVVYVWNKPVLRNRYRLLARIPKNSLDIETVLITDRSKRVLLEVANGNIRHTFVGINLHLLDNWWVDAFVMWICVTGFLYPVYMRLFKLLVSIQWSKKLTKES